MYVFGVDIPVNVAMAIGVVLHVIEFVLAVLIVRRLRRRGSKARDASATQDAKKARPEDYDKEVEEEWSSLE